MLAHLATPVVAIGTLALAAATFWLAKTTISMVKAEVDDRRRALIVVSYERDQDFDRLVFENTGRGGATDLKLLRFNGADGTNAFLTILSQDDGVLPLRWLTGGARVFVRLVRNDDDAAPPYDVLIDWHDGLGYHLGGGHTVT